MDELKFEAVDNSNQIAVRHPERSMAIVPNTVADTIQIARHFAKSMLVPADLRGKEADCFIMIMFGLELGLPPASALRSIHIIKGKPSLAADAAHALCLRHPDCDYFEPVEELTKSGIQAAFKARRRGRPEIVRTFTHTMAKTAGLIKPGGGWEKWTDQMLEARAKMWVARLTFPEKLAGVYCPEETERFDDAAQQFTAPPAPSDRAKTIAVREFDETDKTTVIDIPTGRAQTVDKHGLEIEFAKLIDRINGANADELRDKALVADCKAIREFDETLGQNLAMAFKNRKAELRSSK